jgi:hypothetical protein
MFEQWTEERYKCGGGTEFGCKKMFEKGELCRVVRDGREKLGDRDDRIVMYHWGCWPYKEDETMPVKEGWDYSVYKES